MYSTVILQPRTIFCLLMWINKNTNRYISLFLLFIMYYMIQLLLGDSLSYANGQKFSTYDKDQDAWGSNCALTRRGGFWFNACQYTNPNGLYLWGESSSTGIHWYHWKSNYISLKSISMKMRPVSLRSDE